MSASTWTDRNRKRALAAKKRPDAPDPDPDPQEWIGVDVSHLGTSRPSRALLPLLILALLVALGVASLRIDLIRTRYALAEATAEEKRLIAEQHSLIVRKRQLVDPVALAVLARERGFRPAEAVRVLADPMPMAGTTSARPSSLARPHVASAPPTRIPAAGADAAPRGDRP